MAARPDQGATWKRQIVLKKGTVFFAALAKSSVLAVESVEAGIVISRFYAPLWIGSPPEIHASAFVVNIADTLPAVGVVFAGFNVKNLGFSCWHVCHRFGLIRDVVIFTTRLFVVLLLLIRGLVSRSSCSCMVFRLRGVIRRFWGVIRRFWGMVCRLRGVVRRWGVCLSLVVF